MQLFPVHINRVSKMMATSRCDGMCFNSAKTFDEQRLLEPARLGALLMQLPRDSESVLAAL